MKISVVLASWNGAAYIEKQLRSLAEQTRAPDEVIICDDASFDDTVEVIRRFLSERGLSGWRLEENTENLGYIRNFRRAMQLCTGELIFLCDQDDIWHPDKIRRMEECFSRYPRIRALASGYRTIDRDDMPVFGVLPLYRRMKRWRKSSLHRIRGSVFYENVAQGCACAYRRPVVEEYLSTGADCLLPHDWALNALAFRSRSLYYLKEELLSYRIHGGNAIGVLRRENTVDSRSQVLREFEQQLSKLEKLPASETEKQRDRRYRDFIRYRIALTEKGGLLRFAGGFLRYPRFLLENSLLSYCKDYAVSLKKRKTAE